MKIVKLSFFFLLIFLLSQCTNGFQGDYNSLEDASFIGFNGTNNTSGTNTENYEEYEENDFVNVSDEPISTFSIDADGGSYTNARRFIEQDNELPPQGAIRTEEFMNYFQLDYEQNSDQHPISINGEVSECPWNPGNKLVRIGLKGDAIPQNELPYSNYVLLIDVSGSMNGEDRLELLKEGFKLLVDEMEDEDRMAIVTYAGEAGVLLESTSASEKEKIKAAIDNLGSGGSTNGAGGIIEAYEIAEQNYIEGGNNRIILGSDGAFNVGISSTDKLIELIEEKRDKGIFLTTLGVGRGNLNDNMMEQLANNGNGNYEYLDKVEQLQKVFIYEKSKFYTVAKDVKIQVEFNPSNVYAYRLIGYENRVLNNEDFEDDQKDAGELGADQNVTALYEIIPAITPEGKSLPTFSIDLRYKLPDEESSSEINFPIFDEQHNFSQSTEQMQFVSSVAAFAMLLFESEYVGNASYDKVLEWLSQIEIEDKYGLKEELKVLINMAKGL